MSKATLRNRVAVMQPYLFPYIGYFQLIEAVDVFILLDDVTYIKKGWINRNRILGAEEPQTFTLPLTKPSQNKLIKDTYLHESYPQWRDKFLKTIQHTYSKAPYFEGVYSLVDQCLDIPDDSSISELCRHSLRMVCWYLRLSTLFESSSSFTTEDLKAENKILKICKDAHATHYVNLSGGKSLYSFDSFSRENISLSFISSQPISYSQFGKDPQPWLSIIDVLMFNHINEVKEMLTKTKMETENENS